MKVNGKPTRTIWLGDNGETVEIIDQTKLPFEFIVVGLNTLDDAAVAISDMLVRGAPLIGATAAYGMALAVKDDPSDTGLDNAYKVLFATRPTAINLRWALDDLKALLAPLAPENRQDAAYKRAQEICDEDVDMCSSLGEFGSGVIEDIWTAKGNRTGSTFSPIATPGGWRQWTGEPPWRPFTRPLTPVFRCMCGSMRRGRATRAPASPVGNWASMACPIP